MASLRGSMISINAQPPEVATAKAAVALRARAASDLLRPISEEAKLTVQISAPSYFFSLRENEAPPFKKPGHEMQPRALTGSIMSPREAILMVAASDVKNGLDTFLRRFLVDKKIIENHDLSEKTLLISLLKETIDYAAQRDFSALKLSVLVTIYLSSHLHYKHYYWLKPSALWGYFKELMIRHTIEDTPDGEEVYDPEECYDIMSHFHAIYLTNLPLVHIGTFGVHRFKLLWPSKSKAHN